MTGTPQKFADIRLRNEPKNFRFADSPKKIACPPSREAIVTWRGTQTTAGKPVTVGTTAIAPATAVTPQLRAGGMQVHKHVQDARNNREATASAGSTTIARKQTTAGEKSKKSNSGSSMGRQQQWPGVIKGPQINVSWMFLSHSFFCPPRHSVLDRCIPKQTEDQPKQFDREHILLFLTENLGFFRFFSYFSFFSFFSVCFKTDIGSKHRNKPKFFIFGFTKQTETSAKQILFWFVSVRTKIYFCLFREHPNPDAWCWDG